mgnify:CR=1 FL=1
MSFSAIIRSTFASWSYHEAPRLGAALAFYTILSLAPLMILIVSLAAFVFGFPSAQSQILMQVQSMLGQQGAEAVKAIIEQAQKPSDSITASVLGMVMLLFGASGVFEELRSALNKIWNVQPVQSGHVAALLRERFFSFGMVLAIGFLLLVSLLFSAGLAALCNFCNEILPVSEWTLRIVNMVVSFFSISIVFALIFKFVPNAQIAWNPVIVGALLTSSLFSIGKVLIGLYLGKAAVGSAYGAAGSLVVIVVWVYYSSQIFFLGAEFTHALATSRNPEIQNSSQ